MSDKNEKKLADYYPEFVLILPEWHPVKKYYEENHFLNIVLEELETVKPRDDFQKFYNIFNQICEIEKRYVRKENQLFPFLEKKGWVGPSQGMWAFQDSIRAIIRKIKLKIDERNLSDLELEVELLTSEIKRMMTVEEMRLFPYALTLLTEQDWRDMSVGEVEIGWMFKDKPSVDPIQNEMNQTDDNKGFLKMCEGRMTLEQINFLLKIAPVDLTFVDENDRVIFYNRGEDRVFPRSAGVIGREVRFCHPPKSVHMVLRILEEFRKGTKDEAEFWINYRGRKIHIRYFAIRDEKKVYRGVIEMSQDISNIQKLEGEKRLLEWDEG